MVAIMQSQAEWARLLLLFGGLVVFVVCFGCLVFSCAATSIVTLSSFEQGDLCRTCTHSASTRAKNPDLLVKVGLI